jgi:hypothetical protein
MTGMDTHECTPRSNDEWLVRMGEVADSFTPEQAAEALPKMIAEISAKGDDWTPERKQIAIDMLRFLYERRALGRPAWPDGWPPPADSAT